MYETFDGFEPKVDPEAWVHRSAQLIGDVHVGARATIWPGVVLRGDEGGIEIGEETSIQDNTVAHNTGGWSVTRVGRECTVGHRVLLHGCTVGDHCLIGMGAILLDNCEIGDWSIVGAGALVTIGKKFPPRSLILGSPAKVVRELTEQDFQQIRHGRDAYLELLAKYKAKEG